MQGRYFPSGHAACMLLCDKRACAQQPLPGRVGAGAGGAGSGGSKAPPRLGGGGH